MKPPANFDWRFLNNRGTKMKNIIAFILALLTLFFWLTDEKSQLNFTLNGTVYALSIPEAAIGLFVFFLLAELLFLSFRATVTMLKNDVLLSNHSFQNDKE